MNTRYRHWVQYFFLALSILIGIRFYFFYKYYLNGGEGLFLGRPNGVEAFLPLSALVGLKSWLSNGSFDYIHPAGLILLLFFICIALILRKSFCSWICPFGWISEKLSNLAHKIIGKQFVLPSWLDNVLRSIKYILLGFFLWSIMVQMNAMAASTFMHSDYNKISDVKMLLFIIEMTKATMIGLLIIIVLTFYIKDFWCRYLCPYGALMGLVGWFSPSAISRNPNSCIDCNRCNRACPNRLDIMNSREVISAECNTCMACIDACPQADTLNYQFVNRKLNGKKITIILLLSFFIVVGISMLTGIWYTELDGQDYLQLIPYMNSIIH